MTTNSQLSTTEPKKQTLSKKKNRITEIGITWRVISGEEEGKRGKGTWNKKHKW